jgi:hypothetical protein
VGRSSSKSGRTKGLLENSATEGSLPTIARVILTLAPYCVNHDLSMKREIPDSFWKFSLAQCSHSVEGQEGKSKWTIGGKASSSARIATGGLTPLRRV